MIYSGLGFLAPVLFLLALAGVLHSEDLFGDPLYDQNRVWLSVLLYAAAGTVVWLLGRWLNRRPVMELEFDESGRKVVPKAAHTVFFVRMELWGPILFVVFEAMSLMAGRSTPPPSRPPKLLPIVDESEASARQPLSTVLDLDYMHNGNAYVLFDDSVRSRLRHRQFQDLDTFAAELRKSKARLPGGAWRLFRMYSQIAEPAAGGDAPEEAWQEHFKLLEEWIRELPNSITARVAYADSLLNYAWKARGSGFASKVSQKQWDLFSERLGKAEKVLIDARSLTERCPHWYSTMMGVALGLSYDRKQFDNLYEEAVAFEPLYRPYYFNKAYYLLPRWHGNEGEWESFLPQAADKLGGQEGSTIFYYAFTALADFYEEDELRPLVKQFWPRIEQGYADTDALYHLTFSMVDDYSHFAYLAGDRAEARTAFDRIGPHWNEGFWRTREEFERVKKWAHEN